MPKAKVISANIHKYSVSLMCKLLKISRQTYYNYVNNKHRNKELLLDQIDCDVYRTFSSSRGSFGTRSIKSVLRRENIIYSRKTIAKSMIRQNLSSTYNKSRKPKVAKSNKDEIANLLKRNFKRRINEVLTSDLTYVNVNNQHQYVCFVIDLYNSEIVGYSTSHQKTPTILLSALNRMKINLSNVDIFHTDRGGEFKNRVIDELLLRNNVKRSLSKAGTPADNAVSESAFKTFKYAWNQHRKYNDELELQRDVEAYVNWYNNIRPHSRLEYQSPVEFRLRNVTK